MNHLTTSFWCVLLPLMDCFRVEVFATFSHMAVCWIVCLGPRTIRRVWQTTGRDEKENHANTYRLFIEAKWNWDNVARIWVLKVLLKILPGCRLRAVIDDTLCHKRGAKVAFGGIFLDPVLSTKRHKTFRFAVNYVTLGLLIYLPFRKDRPFGINVLWRTARKKKDAGQNHKTKPTLAREMIDVLATWLPEHGIEVLADVAYIGQKVLKNRPANVCVIGSLTRRASLYEFLEEIPAGKKTHKGEKLPKFADILQDPERNWSAIVVQHPRIEKKLNVHELTAVCWPGGNSSSEPIQVVLLRDPQGHWRDEVLLSTDTNLSAASIVREYLDRWYVECAYADSKQLLGFHDPHVRKQESVERAHPMAWFVGGLVIVWYARFGPHRGLPDSCEQDVSRRITFREMLSYAKLELWSSWLQHGSGDSDAKLSWLLKYICSVPG
ncbi:MAG: transposase [Gemmataceae bacterium]